MTFAAQLHSTSTTPRELRVHLLLTGAATARPWAARGWVALVDLDATA